MPIIVKDFTWNQTDSTVFIGIPLKDGTTRSQVDFFKTNNYLKINYSPFLFEVFFWSEVKGSEIRCLFAQRQMCLEVPKLECGRQWEDLERTFESNEEKQSVRNEAIRMHHKDESLREKTNVETLRNRERESLLKSMEDHEKAKKKMSQRQEAAKLSFFRDTPSTEKKPEVGPHRFSTTLALRVAKEKEAWAKLPPPREAGTILVTFSQSSNPKRESDIAKEPNHKSGSKCAPQEDKAYLLKRGGELFHANDLEAAIEVFTHGAKRYPTDERFLNNRSACYLKTGNYHGTLADCSQVLECLGKRGPMDDETAGKVHTRRSFALQELEMFREALIEMDAAIQYLASNPSLIEMRERLREMVA